MPLGTVHTGAPADLRAIAALVREHDVDARRRRATRCRCRGRRDRGAARRGVRGGAPRLPVAFPSCSTTSGSPRWRPSARCGRPGSTGRERRRVVDRSAATVILQAWLDAPTADADGDRRRGRYPRCPMEQDPHRAGRTGPDAPDGRPGRRALLVLARRVPADPGWPRRGVGATTTGARAPAAAEPVAFTVAEGRAGEEVVEQLHDQGVVRCGGLVGRLLLRSGRQGRRRSAPALHAHDEHDARRRDRACSPRRHRRSPTVRLTIPEGYRLTQIAERVQEALGIPREGSWRSPQGDGLLARPYLPEGRRDRGIPVPGDLRFAKAVDDRERRDPAAARAVRHRGRDARRGRTRSARRHARTRS